MTKREIELHKLISRYETLLIKVENVSSFTDTGRAGCKYRDTDYDSESAVYGFNLAMAQIHEIVKGATNSEA